MEYSCFCTGARRHMSIGNHNLYKTGVVHMDRVMQEHDFIYLLEGEWEIEQNGIMYTMRPDDILILHAGEHHGGRIPCSDGTHTMYLHIEASPDDRFSFSGAEGETEKERIWLPTLVSCRRNPRVRERFQEILSMYWESALSAHKMQKIALLFDLLLLEIADCLEPGVQRYSAADTAARLIQSNPQRLFTEAELAAQTYISEKSLRAAFQCTFGQTPYRYQMDVKLRMAAAYLENHPHMTLEEIACNLGFCDEFHLSRRFKDKYGISPGTYRKKKSQLLGNKPIA